VAADADQRRFADALRAALKKSGLHESEYRRMVLADGIHKKIQEKFQAEVPATVQQAKVDVIATSTTDAANAAIARVKNGEDWATVAKEVSTDSAVKTDGGIKDYGPQGSFHPAYDGYVFSAALGQISEPLIYNTGNSTTYYVVRVEDRADKPVTDSQKTTVATKRYNDWLSDMQSQMNVVKDFDDQSKLDALTWVAENRLPPSPTVAAPAVQSTVAAQPTGAEQPTANPADVAPVESPPVPNQPVAPGGNGQ
jgi:parvulin-like peptidyl-prolyl isomerase